MAFFEDLMKKATGLLDDVRATSDRMSINQQGDPLSSDISMPTLNTQGIVPSTLGSQTQQPQEGVYSSPKGQYKIDPISGKPIIMIGQPEKAKNDIESIAAKDPGMFKRIFGMNVNDAKAMWKDKGGFEGLMSNPAFTLGLGIMQSASKGEPITQSMLDNALKAGAISDQYAKQIKERSKVLGPVTEDQREEVRSVLAESDIFEGSVGQKFKNFFKGKNTAALNRRALDDIYNEASNIAKKKASGGKEVRIDRDIIEQAVKNLKASGKLDISDKGIASFFFGRGIQSKAPGLAEGGPAKAGKEYIVGEKGPEMFVPQVDGNVINNDDAKVVNMLLESNPQLKSISRARAVKILKNRFPDYF
jgi:hypothetical protein